jgi:hypothetical protein
VILLLSATAAGSVALAGFGVDCLIEIVASAVVVWPTCAATQGSDRERRTLRTIAVALVLLATYIALQSTITLPAMSGPGPRRWASTACARRITPEAN